MDRKRILSDGTSAKDIKDPNKRALKNTSIQLHAVYIKTPLGTDIDINNLNNSYFESGRGLKNTIGWLKMLETMVLSSLLGQKN